MSRDLVEQRHLIDVVTGETLPATAENAHRVITVGRDLKRRIDSEIAAATDFLLEESRVQGTKTFHTAAGEVSLSGGPAVEYDAHTLEELLRDAGCPEERIRAVVVEQITYKVNQSVLRQLVAANPDYAAAADLAKQTVEKPWRATAK